MKLDKQRKIIRPFLVVAILCLALALRVYRLNLNAPSLYADEVSGHFLNWVSFALPFSSLLNWLYINLIVRTFSFTWLFGLTPLGARLPAAVYGTALVACLYFFAQSVEKEEGKKDRLVALLTIILAAVLPWGIHLSRIGHTAIPIMLVFVCLHLILYLRARGIKDYLLSVVPLLVATYYYSSMLIISPIIFLLILKQLWSQLSRCQIKLLFPTLLILFVFWALVFSRWGARGIDLAIWRDVNVTADTNISRGLARLSEPTIFSLGQNPEVINRFFYNYPISVISVFVKNYLSFFSPEFLFLKGDPVLRHSSGLVGIFFPFLLPFMVLGAFSLFRSSNRKIKEMFLIWILISPVPAAITKDGFGYLLRVATILPFLTYLAALGLTESVRVIRGKLMKRLYIVGLVLISSYSVFYFLFGYFQIYPALAAKSHEFGFKEVSDFQAAHDSKPLLVIWDGYYPHSYFRFWQVTPAKEYFQFVPRNLQINQTIFYQMFPNLFFSLPKNEFDLQEFVGKNLVSYLAFPADLAEKFSDYSFLKFSPLATVFYPDRSAAFFIYSAERFEGKR